MQQELLCAMSLDHTGQSQQGFYPPVHTDWTFDLWHYVRIFYRENFNLWDNSGTKGTWLQKRGLGFHCLTPYFCLAPQRGLEPRTCWLTASRSTD